MNLRHKFGLLAFLYVITLSANFALCSWCLLLYYHSFLEQRASESAGVIESEESSQPEGSTMDSPQVQPAHEAYILRVLGINAVCGLAVGFVGLRLVKRWVIRPVESLRDAAIEIGSGNLSYRIAAPAGDELGELGDEVNTVAASIVTMQGQLVEHERRQVAGQALRCVVHNIRSPLTGIRWLAEAIGMRQDLDPKTAQTQNRIVEIVDRVLTWLQGFRESLAAVSLQVREVHVSSVITTVVEACTETASKRRIGIETRVTDVSQVRIEPAQFTSALHVLMQNVVARTAMEQSVKLQVGRSKQLPGYWQIVIECGMPPGVKGTSGRSPPIDHDDLSMAERVVRLHGGRIQWEDGPSLACRCVMIMPG